MNPLKMAVVGVGALGRHHARILSQMEGVDLIAVAEVNPQLGRQAAEACQTRWLADFRELDGLIDAVCIAVPTFAHREVGEFFLSRGIPTLIEKPLAGNLDDARFLVDLAAGHGALLQVGHVERFNPAKEVAWSRCGAPRYIRAERVSPYAFRSMDIGVIHDLMIHDIDLVLDLVRSPVVSVEAFGVSILGGHEDSVQARLRFANCCIADLTASRVHPQGGRKLTAWSASGCVSVDFTTREVVHYAPSEALLYGTPVCDRARQPGADIEQLKQQVFGTFLKVERPAVPAADALTAELSHFAECVRTGEQPSCSGIEALAALEVAERVLEEVHAHAWDDQDAACIGPFARLTPPRRAAG